MWIPFSAVCAIAKEHGIDIRGILHLGAHDCEEKESYNAEGIVDSQIYWIEALTEKVVQAQQNGIPNVYEAVIYNEETNVPFYVSNNSQSSSLLSFSTHLHHYPEIGVQRVEEKQSVTLETWIQDNHIPIERLNFWNLDIQGVEYQALESANDFLRFADIIYTEVNIEELYQNVPRLPFLDEVLSEKGFKRVALHMTSQGWGDALYIRHS